MIRRHRGSVEKALATIRGNSIGPRPRFTSFTSAMAACSPRSYGAAS